MERTANIAELVNQKICALGSVTHIATAKQMEAAALQPTKRRRRIPEGTLSNRSIQEAGLLDSDMPCTLAHPLREVYYLGLGPKELKSWLP